MMLRFIYLFCFSAFITAPVTAAVTVSKNEQSGLLTWSAEENGFSIEFIQLLPDFVRAIYGSHGFPKTEIEAIAGYCVFGTIIKNTTSQSLHYDVSDWRYLDTGGMTHSIKTKPQWIEQWKKAGIVFSWTLLPEAQTFAQGDWQQGFTTIKLSRNESFNFQYQWTLGGIVYTAEIPGMRCAPEELPNE